MIAGVEEASSLSKLQVNEMYKKNLLTPTQISNYWDDLWSEEDEEEEAPDLLIEEEELVILHYASDDEEEKKENGRA